MDVLIHRQYQQEIYTIYYHRKMESRVQNDLASGLKDIPAMDLYKALIFQPRTKKYGFKLRELERFSAR